MQFLNQNTFHISNFKELLQTFSIFFSTFLVTVATILGTGILALPVKLSVSGFWPFFATFTICLFAQIALVFFMIELLQKAHAIISKEENIQLQDIPHPDAFMHDSDGDDTDIHSEFDNQDLKWKSSSNVETINDPFNSRAHSLPNSISGNSRNNSLKSLDSLNSFDKSDKSDKNENIENSNHLFIVESENINKRRKKINKVKSHKSIKNNYENDSEGLDLNAVSDKEIKSSRFSRKNSTKSFSELDLYHQDASDQINTQEYDTSSTPIEVTAIEVEEINLDEIPLDTETIHKDTQSLDHIEVIVEPTTNTKILHGNKLLSTGPDLHFMSNIFLPRALRFFFELSVIGHFLSILISYGLAGPKAIAQLFGIGNYFQFFIPLFILLLGSLVIFGSRLIHIIISWATLFKGILLVTMVIVVGIISNYVNQKPNDNWQFIGRPFLISTVALGGTCNTLPIIFSNLTRKGTPSKVNVHVFRLGAIVGVFVCFVINVFWCLFILHIVPQTGGESSLEHAEQNGDISTVGLVKVISLNPNLSQFKWIGILVEIFISTSISVSFVTMSSGLKHVLDGYAKSFKKASKSKSKGILGRIMSLLQRFTRHPTLVIQFTLYILFFGIILIVALLNPKSFFIVMEVFASLALNLESGFFITIMYFISRTYQLPIPVKLPRIAIVFAILVLLYFGFAVLYDLIYSGINLFLYFTLSDYEIPF